MRYLSKIILFIPFTFFLKHPIFSQHLQENIDYMEQKENELTNDSSYWENASVFYTGFNRVSLYNWAAGGLNFMELHGLADMWFDYRHNKFHWNNFIGLSLGVMKTGYGNDGTWLKNDDRIEITSKFSRRTPHLWDYSFLVNIRTQFTKGYYTEYDMESGWYMDDFFSPVYPVLGFGWDYHANYHLTAYFSPITAKSTIVLDDSLSSVGVFGLKPGQKRRTEAGLYMNLLYTHDSLFHNKSLSLMSDLTLFSNYLYKPQNVDVTWELLTTYRISEFFSITFSGYLIYDHDIKIPRFDSDGNYIYMQRDDGSLYNYSFDDPDGYDYYLDYEGDVIKSGAALQFMEYWMLGLSFTF